MNVCVINKFVEVNILILLLFGFKFILHLLNQDFYFHKDCSFWIDDFKELSCMRIVLSANIASSAELK